MSFASRFLDELEALPEGISSSELAPYWERILNAWDQSPGPVSEYAECIFELAGRQWHSYEYVAEPIKARLSVWVSRAWNPAEPNLIGYLLGIIGNLGLEHGLELARACIENPNVSSEVQKEVSDALREFGPQPLDPYASMKKNES